MSYEAIQADPEAHAEGLGIEFVEAPIDQVRQLEDDIGRMADQLGVRPTSLVIPNHGFIREQLTAEQQQALTDRLDLDYSMHFTALQDTLMDLPLHENGERMVHVPREFGLRGLNATFSSRPMNQLAGEQAGKPRVFHARESVARALGQAAHALDAIDILLHFEDIFRPLGVQEGLFQRAINIAREAHPDAPIEAIIAQARSKVAFAPCFAGHKGGAAADLSLVDAHTGERLDTGHDYADHGACVTFDFPYITFAEFRARQLFAHSMRMVGLEVYPGEDWHASGGDLGAAVAVSDAASYPAVYGPIKSFDLETGEIEPYDPADYHRQFDFVVDRMIDRGANST